MSKYLQKDSDIVVLEQTFKLKVVVEVIFTGSLHTHFLGKYGIVWKLALFILIMMLLKDFNH